MLVSIPSAALHGVDAYRVDVEIDVSGGLPAYQVVGLAATSIKEGASRIRSALRNCGQDLPSRKIVVNLAPADRRKDGAAYDLPIAVGVVVAAGEFSGAKLQGLLVLGELGLDGLVRPVRGVLAAAAMAREQGLRGVIVPRACAAEAAVVPGIEVYGVEHLADVLRALLGEIELPLWRGAPSTAPIPPSSSTRDFRDVRGHELARSALEIAVAGGHNVLLYGQPGVGKTLLASCIPTILPPLSHEEAIEVTKVYSAVGMTTSEGLITRRPFRAPHHTISSVALIGGSSPPRPGEVTLAHRGVLFLDELPEFSRASLEALRQPLEDRVVRIGRARGSVWYPASFLLVASANPCPCGWFGSQDRQCTCSLRDVERYRHRLSGPLLDRIDLQIRVDPVRIEELRGTADGESSEAIRARVVEARERQARRLAPYGIRLNAELSPALARRTIRLDDGAERALANLAAKRAGITTRAIERIVRVARTICDLRGTDVVTADVIHEVGFHRALDNDPLCDPRKLLPVIDTPASR